MVPPVVRITAHIPVNGFPERSTVLTVIDTDVGVVLASVVALDVFDGGLVPTPLIAETRKV